MSQTNKVINQIHSSQNMYSYIRFVENEDLRRRHTNKKPALAPYDRTPIRRRRKDEHIDALVETIDPEILA